MKALIAAIAVCIIALTNSAQAETFGRVIEVQNVHSYAYVDLPENRCYDVSVPVYGSRNPSSDDVLLGMIIGGALGKVITGDNNGAIVGAFIGGVSSSGNTIRVQVGTRIERQCEKIYVQQRVPVVTSYVITYRWNGNLYTTETNDYYEIGDQVRMVPQIQ